MNHKFHKAYKVFGFLLAAAFLWNACVKNDFDTPDPMVLPVGEVHTLAELRQMFAANNNQPIKFTEDVSVYGVITMDGSSGNIYRGAYMQDGTAAINLRIMSPGGLYQGDSIHLNLKGTLLSAYENMLQIDSVHTGKNVAKLATKVEVEPLTTNINNLLSDASLQARLIRLEGVEFHQNELGKTYADGENLITQNRILRDCDGNEILVRTSGFASFADYNIPEGNGSFVAVLAHFRDDKQLYIRDIEEVQLDGDRCPTPGEDMESISIAEIRQLQAQGTNNIPPNRRLDGVIISDREHENHPGQNLFIMDENGDGLALRFASFHNFDLGDQLRVLVGSLPISRFNGLLQVESIPLGNGYVMGEGTLPEPTTTTLGNLVQNFSQYESTLIRLENVTIPPAGSFNGNITITDGTAEVIMRTYAWASFANTPVSGGIYNMVAIASYYNGAQLQLRSLSDLEFLEEYDPGSDDETISIAQLRQLFNDGASAAPAGAAIEGIITSDKDNGNHHERNAVIQDESGGIALRFTANHDLNMGDKVRIHVGTVELSQFNGLLQLNNLPNGNASLLATGQSVEPVVTTIDNLLNNMNTFESIVVTIENATISGGSNFQGERTVNDGTGSIMLFTRNQASFASSSVPSQAVKLTGIVAVFNNPQILMRNLNDIEE